MSYQLIALDLDGTLLNSRKEIPPEAAEAVRAVCGEGITVRSRVPSTGGDINRGWTLALSDGGRIFMKENRRENLGFFTAEAKGLEVIRQTGAVRVPEVLALGTDGENAFLLLEYIEPGRGGRASSEELGRGLARMHRADTKALVPGGKFGFSEDNYIGAGAQINTPKQTWREFFIRCRLLPQFRRAEEYFDRPERTGTLPSRNSPPCSTATSGRETIWWTAGAVPG